MVSCPGWYENGSERVMNKIVLTLLAVLCTVFMSSCSSVITKNPQLHREWMLVSFGNYTRQDLMKHHAKIDLTSRAEEEKITGGAYMGCNRMFFSFKCKRNGTLKISGFGSTMMACNDMKLEDEFSQSFKNIVSYSVKGHFLTLTDDQGNAMKFVAADWD